MPTALSTTKRKFHKLLDSISNASSTSLPLQHDKFNASTSTLPAQTDNPSKKLCITRPRSAHVPQSTNLLHSPSRPIRSPAVATTQTTPVNTRSTNAARPNFAPWDRGQFLSRLKTFRHVDKWTGKPDKISEVEWARRGWSCIGKETVGCVGGCAKEVMIQLEDAPQEDENEAEKEEEEEDWRKDAQEQLVEEYSEMISTAHEESCLWRRRGCDDTIQRLPVIQYSTAVGDLRTRYSSLQKMASELPPSVSTPSTLDTTNIERQLGSALEVRISDTPTTDSEPASSINRTALLLALFGWQAEENHIAGLATCNACFRRLGLWLFKPPSDDASSESSMDRLDVVGEHRDYCPWINPLSQNGSKRRSSLDGLSGWESLLRTILARNHSLDNDGEGNEGQEKKSGSSAALASGNSAAGDPAAGEGEDDDDDEARDRRDKERFAKLKRVSQIFKVKGSRKSVGDGKLPQDRKQ